ncbi:MAG: hypothetical protein ACI8RN_002440 [Glaciecola sp.]
MPGTDLLDYFDRTTGCGRKPAPALGVIVSLGLVIYAMKQAREHAMAELYLVRSSSLSELVGADYRPEMAEQAEAQIYKDVTSMTYF